MRYLMLSLSLLPGCFQTVSVPTCDEQVTPVADDEPTPQGTAAELLSLVVGLFEEPAWLEDETGVVATVQIERGEGTAEHVDLEHATTTTRKLGFGHMTLTWRPECEDYVRVPVQLALATDDGSIDLALEGSARSGGGVEYAALGPAVHVRVPFDSSGMPEPEGLDRSEWTEQEAFVNVDFSDEGTSGRAGWSGDGVNDNSSMARYLLTWPESNP